MVVLLLDESLIVDVIYDPADNDLADNIGLSLSESCPEEEKILLADETVIYITSAQARTLAAALLKAADESDRQMP